MSRRFELSTRYSPDWAKQRPDENRLARLTRKLDHSAIIQRSFSDQGCGLVSLDRDNADAVFQFAVSVLRFIALSC